MHSMHAFDILRDDALSRRAIEAFNAILSMQLTTPRARPTEERQIPSFLTGAQKTVENSLKAIDFWL